MKRIILALTLPLILASSAGAEYYAFGEGTATCGEFSDHHDAYGKSDTVEQWVFGYVTGRNFENASLKGEESYKAFYATFLKYCRDNPLDKLFYAADSLYNQLR